MGGGPPDGGWLGPPPSDAVEWLRRRTVLLGKWDRDLDDAVNRILIQALETGATRKQISKALAAVFIEFSKARLENIARTETTSALTQGRLNKFREPGSRVAGVQFVAILDARTTEMCRSRDGLMLRLNDPRLALNTPPLHYQCRSTLVPVSEWDWEDLLYGNKDAQERFFGYLPPGSPRNLAEALRWDDVPAPLPGFGSVADTKQTPSAPPATAAPKAKSAPQPTKDFAATIAKRLSAGVTTTTDVREVGRLVIDEIQPLFGDLSPLQDAVEKARDAMRVAVRASNTSRVPATEQVRLYQAAIEAQRKHSEEKGKLAKARSRHIVNVLSQVVELGGEAQIWEPRSSPILRKVHRDNEAFIPTKWVKSSNSYGPVVAKYRKDAGDSGVYSHARSGRSSMTVSGSTDYGLASTALHEYGHRIENVRPDLKRLILEYFEERTKGDPREPLDKYLPGISRSIYVKRDKWTEPYFGRLYNHQAVEIFAMGLEGVFYSNYSLWEEDEELLEFIIGAIIAL